MISPSYLPASTCFNIWAFIMSPDQDCRIHICYNGLRICSTAVRSFLEILFHRKEFGFARTTIVRIDECEPKVLRYHSFILTLNPWIVTQSVGKGERREKHGNEAVLDGCLYR